MQTLLYDGSNALLYGVTPSNFIGIDGPSTPRPLRRADTLRVGQPVAMSRHAVCDAHDACCCSGLVGSGELYSGRCFMSGRGCNHIWEALAVDVTVDHGQPWPWTIFLLIHGRGYVFHHRGSHRGCSRGTESTVSSTAAAVGHMKMSTARIEGGRPEMRIPLPSYSMNLPARARAGERMYNNNVHSQACVAVTASGPRKRESVMALCVRA